MAKIIFLLILISPFCLSAQKLNSDSIKNLLPNNFTGQVAIKRNTHFIFKENFGPKERTFGTLINDTTVFNIGQVSQTMVHYFIEHLASLGQIKTTDKVSKYIKSFPYQNILIKHLVEQRSGLPNFYLKLFHRKVYNNWDLKLSEREIRFDNEDILYLLEKEKPKLNFYPGDSIEYSDLNYLVLTSLIEKVTFTPFPDFVEKMFKHHHFTFKPVLSAEKDSVFNSALGYQLLQDSTFQICENLGTRGFPYEDGTYGNQHIYLSAINLTLWGQFIFKNIDIKYLKANPTKEIMGGIKYDSDLEIVIKMGAFGGTYSRLMLIPGNGLIAVINSTVFNPSNKRKEFNKLIEYLKKLD